MDNSVNKRNVKCSMLKLLILIIGMNRLDVIMAKILNIFESSKNNQPK